MVHQRRAGVEQRRLGDAAHVMPPSGGGAELGEAVAARTEPVYAEAHEMLDLCLGDDAPYGLIGLIGLFTGALTGAARPEPASPART
ncbi:hypothetical protein BGM09_20810 [Streptomyces sp. CBMA29]|nr:hypothetical protein [Streptomyces sp. CBMA29]MBD0735547.1 hypothetical protein [Streptomyces sp. CBMA29]